jgi:hypothetical protein
VLVAGAADAGLLALAEESTRGPERSLTVADRCATPLATCEAFAAARGFPVSALQHDFASASLERRYDIVLIHTILQFVQNAARADFMRRLSAALAPGGTLIAAERLRPQPGEAPRHRQSATEMIAALGKAGIPLPETEAAFRQRVERSLTPHGDRLSAAPEEKDMTDYLTDCGLRLDRIETHALRRRLSAPPDSPPDITIQFVAATRV